LNKKSVLIVDDDQTILSSLKEILELRDYVVDTAETGREAIEKFESKWYNAALLDIKLPDMDGTNLLAKMHKDKPGVIKIMVTGYPTIDNAKKSLNQGADAYLIKPVKPGNLLKVLEEKLREREAY